MKADVVKKHHFWLVAGASLLMVLLAFFMLSGGVSEAIETEQKEIKKAADSARTAQAPGQAEPDKIEKQKKDLEAKKDDLWKENWEAQKKFYTWPVTADNMFAEYNAVKFGDPLKGADSSCCREGRRDTRPSAVRHRQSTHARRVRPCGEPSSRRASPTASAAAHTRAS